MYNANIKTIPFAAMRYDTLGDWLLEGGCNQIRVASMGNSDYEFLVAIHELIEQRLCKIMGISEQTVDAFDLAHEDDEEPGAREDCPYREAHMTAEAIERVVATKMGVNWEHYSEACRTLLKSHLPPLDPTRRDREHDDFLATSGKTRAEYQQKHYYRGGGRKPKMSAKQKQRSVLRGK